MSQFPPQTLAEAPHHSVPDKQSAGAAYDIDRINGKTETGGLNIDGTVDQTIVAGGTAQDVTNWSGVYKAKVVVGSAVNGTLITTAGLNFDICGELTIRRKAGISDGKLKITVESDNDGVLFTKEVSPSANILSSISFALSAVAITAASTISIKIGGATKTSDVIEVSDAYLFIESTT